MLPPRSTSSAQATERPVLAPDWLVLAMAAMVCLALWLIYPRQDLEKRLAGLAESELTNAYLSNLLRSDPDNPHLRLLLAQRQIAHGEVTHARRTLAPALASSDPELHRQALWTQWELALYEYNHLPASADQRQAQSQAIRQQIQELAQIPWPPAQTLRLATWASQFQENTLALALFTMLIPDDPQAAAQFYRSAAQEALARGDYHGSARLYLQASTASPSAREAKALYIDAVRTLQSGNQMAAALALAEAEVGPWASDPEVLTLLVNLARAAGQPDVAEKYVRQLLRQSLSGQWKKQEHLALANQGFYEKIYVKNLISSSQPAPETMSSTVYDDGARWLRPRGLPMADQAAPPALPPFDEKTYLLGYQVFLENGKLQDAWLLASAAVQHRPEAMDWRERLAQTSEWTGRQPQALQHWLALARRTGSDAAWQAVLRLAPGLFDDAALAEALGHALQARPGDRALLHAFVATQERAGEPQAAIAFLQRHTPTADTLELLAQLAERAGQPALALATWQRLLADPGQLNAQRAMQAALLALRQGQPDQGLAWLEAAHALPPPQESEAAATLWRDTGAVAESRDHQALAVDAYRQLTATPEAELTDFDGLIRLLLAPQPLQAAEAAWQAWERFHEPRHLLQAWTVWSNRNQWPLMTRSLAQLQAQPQHWPALQQSPEFLRLLGAYHQNFGRLELARKYYEAGFALAPDSDAMRQALLWLFIDSNDAVALQRLLTQYESRWSQSEAMHDSLAAAYQALSQPQVALQRYLTPQASAHENDFLWLMNYADALGENQQSDQAWRLRRALLARQWHQARQGSTGQRLSRAQASAQWLTQEGVDTVQRIARARLNLTQQPGDPALEVLRELLRLDRDAQGNYSNAAAETAIGWLQDAAEYGAERRFLHHQYARSQGLRSHRPLWADITLALAEEDRAATGQLLETFDQRLPRYDRVNAAAAMGDLRRAQSAAFETQDRQTDDDPLHLQLTNNLLAFSDHVAVRGSTEQLGDMDETGTSARWHRAISPRLSLDIGFASVRRMNISSSLATTLPEEKIFSLLARWQHPDGLTQLSAARRQGYADTTPVLLTHDQRIDNRLRWYAELGRQLSTTESLPLRLVGMKDLASLSLRYQASRLDRLALTHAQERYYLQTGAQVGSGRHTTLEYTHTYRQDAPTVDLGAFWSTHSYRRRDPATLGRQGLLAAQRILPPGASAAADPGFYLPENFQFYGLQAAFNMRFEEDYTRAVRPYAMVSASRHSRLGAGYGLRLGLAGNVLGPDHLSLSWGMDKSGADSASSANGLTRNLSLSYRLHF